MSGRRTRTGPGPFVGGVSPRPRHGSRRLRALRRACDERGTTIIEVVVAVAILALLVTPAARLVIETGAAANQDRLRVEASAIATNDLQNIENMALFGAINPATLPQGKQVVAENGSTTGGHPKDTFQLHTYYQVETVGGQSICTTTGTAATAPQIYKIWAEVDWTGDGGVPLDETTYIAPEQGGNVPLTAGELAVPLDTAAGGIFNAVSVDITIVGTSSNGPTIVKTVPSGTGGSGGCAVFTNLDPSYSWQIYLGDATVNGASVSVVPPTNVVTSEELSGLVNGVTQTAGYFSEPAPTLVVGSTVQAPAIVVDQPEAVSVTFPTMQCPVSVTACTDVSTVAPAPSGISVTVHSSSISSPQQTFAFDTYSSSSPGAAISSVELFPYTDYTLWAGDTPDADPQYGSPPDYPGLSPFILGSNVSAALPVYETMFTTGAKAPPAGAQLTVTQYNAPHDAGIPLSAFNANLSASGLPLGEYQLQVTGGHTVSPSYIWVTPTAVYYGSAAASQLSGFTTSSPSGTPIPVTIS